MYIFVDIVPSEVIKNNVWFVEWIPTILLCLTFKSCTKIVSRKLIEQFRKQKYRIRFVFKLLYLPCWEKKKKANVLDSLSLLFFFKGLRLYVPCIKYLQKYLIYDYNKEEGKFAFFTLWLVAISFNYNQHNLGCHLSYPNSVEAL